MSKLLTVEDVQSMTEVDLQTMAEMISRELTKRHFDKEQVNLAATTQYKSRRIFLIYRPEDKRIRPSTIVMEPDKYEEELMKLSKRLSEKDMSDIKTEIIGIIRTIGLNSSRGYELTLPAFDPITGISRLRAIVNELDQIDPKVDPSTISVRYKFGNRMELAYFQKLDKNKLRNTSFADTYSEYSESTDIFQVVIADHQGFIPGNPQFRSDAVRQILLT